jgi:hypothetical protein
LALIAIGALMVFVISALFTFPVKWIINYVFAPSLLTFVFGEPRISFWRTYWFTFIVSLLFETGKVAGQR